MPGRLQKVRKLFSLARKELEVNEELHRDVQAVVQRRAQVDPELMETLRLTATPSSPRWGAPAPCWAPRTDAARSSSTAG